MKSHLLQSQILQSQKFVMNYSAAFLVIGVVLAAFIDAISSTMLSVARAPMMEDFRASVDEFATLDFAYLALKLSAFLCAPWAIQRFSAKNCLQFGTLLMILACAATVFANRLEFMLLLRLVQALAGGFILISGQTLLLQTFPAKQQPIIQICYALGAVAAPISFAPALQGWLIGSLSWGWILLSIIPVGLISLSLLSLSPDDKSALDKTRFDWQGLGLFMLAGLSLAYVSNRGNRFDWWQDGTIAMLALMGGLALMAFIFWQARAQKSGALVNFAILRQGQFAFFLIISIVAGISLFGSSYLINALLLSALGMTALSTGLTLLSGAAGFLISALFTLLLIGRKMRPHIAVPVGILAFMAAMWILSGANGSSDITHLLTAVLLRGFGLGCLFLAMTLMALVGLPHHLIAYGVSLFAIGRQMGGLFGTAFFETLTSQQTTLQNLGQEIAAQANFIAFNHAFMIAALLFIVATPFLFVAKILLSRL